MVKFEKSAELIKLDDTFTKFHSGNRMTRYFNAYAN